MAHGQAHIVDVRDKLGFLERIMEELAGDARMSLEGDLSRCRFPATLQPHCNESSPLVRNTVSPTTDFVVLNLTRESMPLILEQVKVAGLGQAIIHVLIERGGALAFEPTTIFNVTVSLLVR